MANNYFIQFPDPAIAMGSQIATTGETRSEYTRRLQHRIALSNSDYTPYTLKDNEFLTTLPYSIQAEWVKEWDADTDTSVFNDYYLTFLENLEDSFGDDLKNNSAVMNELAVNRSNVLYRKMYATELATTELGGNDAINCYWSFNENDDIIYPTNAIDPNTCRLGLGRIYADVYQKHQVILWLTFGVPEYSGMWEFYNKAYDPALSAELHAGVTSTALLAGRILNKALVFSFNLATWPIYLANLVGKLFTNYTITKYCELNTTMPQYFKIVNLLMGTVAVNMGIQKDESGKVDDDDANTVNYSPNDLPGMMKEGLDIYRIMAKRAIYVAARDGVDLSHLTAQEIYEKHNAAWNDDLQRVDPQKFDPPEYSAGSSSFFGKVGDAILAHGTGSTAYVGFRVEKSVDASESISNSTGESELKGILNAGVEAREKASFMTMGGKVGGNGAIGGAINQIINGISDFAKGLTSDVGLGGLAGLITGTGHYDIPEVWKDSSFSTSYSFRTQLVSHYCDRVSIFQNCYVPMFMILAAALPRQVGNNTYIQPFFCRGYCQGRFAVSYGIIDSVSIKRGSDEYGWTEEGFPTTIDISWSIKDLSPLMFLSFDSGIVKDIANIFEANSHMQEYLSTLGGLGLKDRVLGMKQLFRRLKSWWNVHFETRLLNPYCWGSMIGHIPGVQTALAWKWSRLSNR